MVALSKNSKGKLSKVYRKLDLGGTLSQDQTVRQKLQQQEKVSNGEMVAGQSTANTVGAIPIVGAFKSIGEGASTAFRQDDEYGVASSDTGAAVGAGFNPLKQTTTGISAIGKGDIKTAGLNLIAPPLAAYLENQEARKTRDNAIKDFQNKQSIDLATQRGKQTLVGGNQVYSLTERREGGKLSLLKYPDGGEIKSDSTKVSKKLFSDKSLILHDNVKTDEDFEKYHKNIVTHLKNKYNVSLEPDTNNVRPYYNPINRSISYNPKEDGEVSILTKEVPHAIQVDRDGFLLTGYKAMKDIAKHNDWGDLLQVGGKENTKRYDVKGTFENEAHSEIEPKLKKEFSELNNKVYFGESDENKKDIESLQIKKQGGKLSKISNNTILASGATHEEGGIKLPQLGAEVEDKETLKMTKDGGTYVMSDTLVNPTTGNTFAKDDLKLSKMKGRLEKINHSFGKNALTLLKNKEQKLVDLHEQVRQEQGLETADETQVAKNGGMLKYSGWNPQPSKIEPIGGNPYDNSEFNFPTGQSDKYVSNFQPDYTLEGAINNFQNRTSKGYDIKPTPYRSVVDFQKANGLKADGKWGKNTDDIYYKTFGNKTSKGLTTLNSDYGTNLPKVEGKFMDNPDVAGIDGVAPTKTKGKFNVSKLGNLSAYTDNITGALYNYQRSKEKLPDLKTLDYLNPKHVNYSQAIKDTRDTTTAFNRGVDTTNVNQGNANIMKAFALGEQQKGIARISQEENNANVRIDNDFAGRNKAIEEKNNMTIFNNAERSRLGRDEIRRESQQNIVDANMKFQTQLKSKNQEADDKDAELGFDKRSNDFIESKKAEREANESGIWKNGRFVRRSSRNGGKLSKLKISY